MNNNHKQKVYSVLDRLTKNELDNYIKDRSISVEKNEIFELLSKVKKPETYVQGWCQKISDGFQNSLSSYYKLGQASIISFVLECFYDDKYKIKDLQDYLRCMFKDDIELKEMVYDFMKDF
jgi:hypothetical protein